MMILDQAFNFNHEHKLELQVLVIKNGSFKPCVAPTRKMFSPHHNIRI